MLQAKEIITKEVLNKEFRGVIVAHSGGLDSTALFVQIWETFKDKKNFQLGLFHINYNLRGDDSVADEDFSRTLAQTHNVAFHLRRVSPEEQAARRGESTQEWARRLRYEAMQEFAKIGWIIALAHHEDDVAENVLLRLARGAGPGQLVGMQVWKKPYWRPFLTEKKAVLRHYLEARGIPYRTDSSNAKDEYSRNVIRNRVLPELEVLFPGAASRIAACGHEAKDLAQWCEAQIATTLAKTPASEQQKALRQLLLSSPAGAGFVALGGWFRQFSPQLRLTRQVLTKARQRILSGLPPWPLVEDMQVTSALRHQQHARTLEPPSCSMVLEPGSYGIFKVCDRVCEYAASGANHASTAIKVTSLAIDATLVFAGQTRRWTLKALFQVWQIPLNERPHYQAVYENDVLVGLFDGKSLVRPHPTGERDVSGCLNMSLRTWYSK